jgi:hypothetical protein
LLSTDTNSGFRGAHWHVCCLAIEGSHEKKFGVIREVKRLGQRRIKESGLPIYIEAFGGRLPKSYAAMGFEPLSVTPLYYNRMGRLVPLKDLKPKEIAKFTKHGPRQPDSYFHSMSTPGWWETDRNAMHERCNPALPMASVLKGARYVAACAAAIGGIDTGVKKTVSGHPAIVTAKQVALTASTMSTYGVAVGRAVGLVTDKVSARKSWRR